MHTYTKLTEVGSLSDKPHRVLLRMQQGTAIKGAIKLDQDIWSYYVFASDDCFKNAIKILDYISRICILADDASVPHKCNQGIVFSTGT